MKKYIFAIIITLLFVGMLTGCTVVTTQENQIEVTVASCEQGQFHPHSVYEAMAIKCLESKQATLYAYYSNLAKENGTYDYLVSFEVDGQPFTVTRNEEFKPGDTMAVTQIITSENNSGKILTTEYR